MVTSRDIQDLINQLGGMQYKPPSSYTGYQSGYTPIDRTLPKPIKSSNLTPDDFYVDDKKKKKKKPSMKINFWDLLSGTLGQPSGVVTDTVYKSLNKWKEVGSKKNDTNLAEELLNVLSYNPAKDSLIGAIKAGGKKQMENWKDDKYTWGDVPLVGVLNGMDKYWERGQDIVADHMGVKNKKGQIVGGIALDIALDPLTYLTMGYSAAGKAGKAAELAEIANQSKKLGIAGKFKKFDDFADVAIDTLRAKYKDYPYLVDKIVIKKFDDISKAVETARTTAFNANVNKWGFTIPTTNKVFMGGNISKRLPMYRTEATLGTKYSNIVNDLIDNVAGGDVDKISALTNVVKARYGIDDFAQMTKSQFDDLSKAVKSFSSQPIVRNLPDADVTERMVEKSIPDEIFNIKTKKAVPNETVTYKKVTADEILKGIDPKVAAKIEPLIRGLDDIEDIRKLAPDAVEMFGEFAPKLLKTVKGKTKNEVLKSFNAAADVLRNATHTGTITKAPDIVWKELERVVDVFKHGNPNKIGKLQDADFIKKATQMMTEKPNIMFDGKTNTQHWLNKVNPFEARTLRTGDKFLDSMGDNIANANSQRIGEMSKYNVEIHRIGKYIVKHKVTPDEMKDAIYYLEKNAPETYPKNWKPSDKVIELANEVKKLLTKIGDDDVSAGVLDTLRKDYFPHVINKTDEELKKLLDFDAKHADLNDLSKTNKFNKERKSFPTIADRDNYIEKLGKLIAKEKDPDQKAMLQAQLDRVSDLFDVDIVSALTRRIRESTRARAMKALQDDLTKYGMMSDTAKSGLKKLDPNEAKKLGVEPNTYIHPDVLEGLKRTDEIFTDEGMNKFVRHISAISDIWRPLVTYYKPSHYRNNLIGNTIVNMAAGVHVRDYKVANKLIAGWNKGTLKPSEMKIMQKAYEKNVINGGFLFDAKPNFEFATKTKLEKIAEKVSDNRYVRTTRTYGELMDDVTRLANFVNGLDKYGNVEKAAEQVRKYLFNYNELTNADRSMRVMFPFWNWTKRNIPLQIELLMEQPKFALNNERFRDIFNEGEEGKDWQKEYGIKVNDDYYTSIPSPVNELQTVVDPFSLLSGMNPALRMGMETSMNKKFFNGSPITYGQNEIAPEDIPRYIASNSGIGGNIYDFLSGKKGAAESLINLFNPVSKINHVGEVREK